MTLQANYTNPFGTQYAINEDTRVVHIRIGDHWLLTKTITFGQVPMFIATGYLSPIV